MRRDVRVLLVGDEGVGKSTIITSFIKRSFVEHVQPLLPEVHIPDCLDGVTATIVDSSSRPADRDKLDAELKKAHVICLVYSIDLPSSFDRLSAHYIPYIRQRGVNVPIILIGNKIDKRGRGELSDYELQQEISPIMNEFKEVETCVETSARLLLNITEAVFFALKAVCFPLAPLYDSRTHTLKPQCVAALSRIFRICDTGRDGLLDAAELNEFQRKCFSQPLQLQEIEGIFRTIASHDPSLVSLDPPGITEQGMAFMHARFIQQGRVDTVWTVLGAFGYGEDLELKEEVLRPKLDVPSGCSVELSPNGYEFLTQLFETFDKDADGALSDSELAEAFSTSPGNPWAHTGFPDGTLTSNGKVTLAGWLGMWSLQTLLDHRTTLAYLCYLGYSYISPSSSSSPHPSSSHISHPPSSSSSPSSNSSPPRPTTSALLVTRPRSQDRRAGKSSRQVFLVYVVGSAGSGKTSLLRSFVGKKWDASEKWVPTETGMAVVNSVERGGGEKYLVLQEFGSRYESEVLRSSKSLERADLILYVFDSSDTNSFSYISNLRQQYRLQHLPAVFCATKSDLDLAQQRHEVQPDTYAKRLGLPVPISVSVKQGQTADLWLAICRAAIFPQSATPIAPKSSFGLVPKGIALSAIASLLAGTLFAFRWYRGGSIGGWPMRWVARAMGAFRGEL